MPGFAAGRTEEQEQKKKLHNEEHKTFCSYFCFYLGKRWQREWRNRHLIQHQYLLPKKKYFTKKKKKKVSTGISAKFDFIQREPGKYFQDFSCSIPAEELPTHLNGTWESFSPQLHISEKKKNSKTPADR